VGAHGDSGSAVDELREGIGAQGHRRTGAQSGGGPSGLPPLACPSDGSLVRSVRRYAGASALPPARTPRGPSPPAWRSCRPRRSRKSRSRCRTPGRATRPGRCRSASAQGRRWPSRRTAGPGVRPPPAPSSPRRDCPRNARRTAPGRARAACPGCASSPSSPNRGTRARGCAAAPRGDRRSNRAARRRCTRRRRGTGGRPGASPPGPSWPSARRRAAPQGAVRPARASRRGRRRARRPAVRGSR
jgi:hypothetical protein